MVQPRVETQTQTAEFSFKGPRIFSSLVAATESHTRRSNVVVRELARNIALYMLLQTPANIMAEGGYKSSEEWRRVSRQAQGAIDRLKTRRAA